MAIRQYIGARYVPKYVGHFDSTRDYEPLSIVDDANGNSYTSKIPVPAGSSLDDTRYWAMTGNFSGAVQQLQNRMTAAEENITQAQGDIDQAQLDIGTLNTNLNNLSNLVKNRKIVIVADSYGNYPDTNNETVAQALRSIGWNVVFDFAYGGAGFTKSGDYNIANYPDLYTGNKNEVTDVLFCCSANDTGRSLVEIRGLVSAAINHCKQLYPNAKISVIPWGVMWTNTENAKQLMVDTMQGYQLGCGDGGGVFVSNARYILRNSDLILAYDHVHPTPLGLWYLSRQISNYLVTGEINVYYEMDVTLSLADDHTDLISIASTKWKMTRMNNIVEISQYNAGALSVDAITLNHTPFITRFTPAVQALAIDRSLISIPYSYLGGKFCNMRGYEVADPDATRPSPIPTWGANMKFIPFVDRLILSITPDTPEYQVKRFTGTTGNMIIMD